MTGESVQTTNSVHAIRRTRLIDGVLRSTEPAVMLVGPSGLGKSVLASQIAAAYDATLWIECSHAGSDDGQIARHVLEALRGAADRGPGASLLPLSSDEDVCAALVEAFASQFVGEACLVLDDLSLAAGSNGLHTVATCLVEARGISSRVIATCREAPDGLPHIDASLVVDSASLRMDVDEIAALFRYAGAPALDAETLSQVAEISGGQAAVLRLLARHHAMGTLDNVLDGRAPMDFKEHLRQLATEQLDTQDLQTLHFLALIGSGATQEIRECVGENAEQRLRYISWRIPLLTLEERNGSLTFRMHGIACAAFTEKRFIDGNVNSAASVMESALMVLDARGDVDRLFALLIESGNVDALLRWLDRRGQALLDAGRLALLQDALAGLESARLLGRPKMLLLYSKMLREAAEAGDALRKAEIARELANLEGDQDTVFQAYVVIARLRMDQGEMEAAASALTHAASLADPDRCEASTALIDSYLALCLMCSSRWRESRDLARAAHEQALRTKPNDEIYGRILTALCSVEGVIYGRWHEVMQLFLRSIKLGDASFSLRQQSASNLGTVLCELGRTERAAEVLESSTEALRKRGMSAMLSSSMASLAMAHAARGDYEKAESLADTAVEDMIEGGQTTELSHVLCYRAAWQRAANQADRSLDTAERALETCVLLSCEWLNWLATLEVAASLLAVGDSASAARHASRIREIAAPEGALRFTLAADLIIAETERLDGKLDDGVRRLTSHADYIATDSGNWLITMYSRAFPHLMGMLAAAIGTQDLPPRLIRQVLPEDRGRVLEAARDVLDATQTRELGVRLMGVEEAEAYFGEPSWSTCTVSMFGGLEVRVGERSVHEKAWRKRKARLLFAMMALAQGREIAKEQALEYLWPDMDEARARNNFYVIWSAMKSALAPGIGKDTPCPYVDNSGDACRVVSDLVSSDVASFEALLAEAASFERAGDIVAAIDAYEKLSEVYKGELLPSDIYDDWFSRERDRYRMEFGDAMLRACQLLADEGDHQRALSAIRRGLKADAWREDLYQAALVEQIACGQRSAAIETYMACRKRLAEDLGLDPSADTVALYEQVLAMEDPGSGYGDDQSAD